MQQFITTDHQAELNAAEKMREFGFVDARAVPIGPDGGIDVVSSRALAQVKWKASVAGSPDMQRLYGARGNHTEKQLFFFASAGYSRQAVDVANDLGIALYTYDITGKVTAANQVRTSMVTTSMSVPSPTTRTWVSPDWIALWHVLRPLGAWLKPQPVKHSSNKNRTRRRAHKH